MDIRRLSDDFSVSPQIVITDLQTIWDLGFRTIISNRPKIISSDSNILAGAVKNA